jgi:putative glutamine amidotransferase
MRRPVIGICAALERASWSVWDQQAALLPFNYIEAIQRAGGLAVMLPPDALLVEEPQQALDLIDGLMLAGGADIDPASYGEDAHPETAGTVPQRDRFEVGLVRGALERDMPLLGICRGMQLLNVARGGTLLQHVPERYGHHEHRRVLGSFDGADHDVQLSEGSAAALAAGELAHATKSHHHQGVDRLGEGLVVTGASTLDELPEAIELPSVRFCLGVQWHPEADPASRVIAAFVAAAGEAASTPGDASPSTGVHTAAGAAARGPGAASAGEVAAAVRAGVAAVRDSAAADGRSDGSR